MYRGEVDVSENNLTEFLKTAAGLRVRGLTETDKQQMPPDHDLGGKRKLERVTETRTSERKVRAETSVASSLPVSRMYPHVIPASMEGLVIEEPPSTTAIKEERDLEPSTTWTSTPVVRGGGALVRSESVSGSGEGEETGDLTSDYPLEMTNYQTDISGGYEIEEKDTSYNKDPETMVVGDKLNKAYQCEMCNMSFNQKWLLRYPVITLKHSIKDLRTIQRKQRMFILFSDVTGRPTPEPSLTSAQSALEPSLCETPAHDTSRLCTRTWWT